MYSRSDFELVIWIAWVCLGRGAVAIVRAIKVEVNFSTSVGVTWLHLAVRCHHWCFCCCCGWRAVSTWTSCGVLQQEAHPRWESLPCNRSRTHGCIPWLYEVEALLAWQRLPYIHRSWTSGIHIRLTPPQRSPGTLAGAFSWTEFRSPLCTWER